MVGLIAADDESMFKVMIALADATPQFSSMELLMPNRSWFGVSKFPPPDQPSPEQCKPAPPLVDRMPHVPTGETKEQTKPKASAGRKPQFGK